LVHKGREYLYEHYSARLLAVCQRYLNNRGAAEDVLHDTFLVVFEKMGLCTFMSDAAVYAWMKRIAVNKCIDILRSAAKTPLPLDDNVEIPEDEPPGDTAKMPPDVLMEMIASLPEGYRTVFNLFALEGYSHAEIARMLGIGEKTSSSQYFRARTLLARKIKDWLNNEKEN